MDSQFAAIQVHDDTLTQTGATIKAAAYLKAHAPWMVPIVNQAGLPIYLPTSPLYLPYISRSSARVRQPGTTERNPSPLTLNP